jgi:putative oxidoreductase
MPEADAVRPMVNRFGPSVGLPTDPELAIRANGALQAGAGLLFALGRLPRLSATLLAASLLPSTASELRLWREQDPVARREQRTRLLRHAGLLGGALLGAVDTADRPRLAWRERRAVKRAEKASKRASGRPRQGWPRLPSTP